MTAKELQELIRKKHAIVTTADAELLAELERTQRSIFARIRGIAEKLPNRNGQFIWESKRTQIAEITKTVFDAVRASQYKNKVEGYLRKFDEIESLNKTIMGEVNGLSTKVSLSDEKKQAIGDITRRLVSPESIEMNISQPITQILYDHARFGMNVSDAVKNLEEFITNTEASEGIVSRYVGQISRDAINQYNGTVFQVMQREYGLGAYRYVGGLLKDSRPQCIRWIGHNEGLLDKEYLDAELAEAASLILSGEKSDRFKGYSKYTTPLTFESFAIFRGGHNCIHEAIPVKADGSSSEEAFEGLEENIQEDTTEQRGDQAEGNVQNDTIVVTKQDIVESEARKLAIKASASGEELDTLSRAIADDHNAVVTPINYKSEAGIIRKALAEYGGDVTKVTDAVRNTIIAEQSEIASIAAELKANPLTTRVKFQDFVDSGYRGYLINIKTSEGILGEIQLNTPKMIYAKNSKNTAIRLIGKEKWDAIHAETGLEGGLGHDYYERYRVLDIADPEREKILQLSREYYSHFYD